MEQPSIEENQDMTDATDDVSYFDSYEDLEVRLTVTEHCLLLSIPYRVIVIVFSTVAKGTSCLS